MRKVPICKTCYYMRLISRSKITRNNTNLKGPRGKCHCIHPKAIETFEKVCPRSRRMAGFIGFTAPGENVPQIKTSPKWCPLRLNWFPGNIFPEKEEQE